MRDDLNLPLLALFGALLGLLLLSACGPLETSLESTQERATATVTSIPSTAVPATRTLSPVSTLPASTPVSATATPANLVPTPTETPPKVQILAFGVSPAEVDPGD